MLLRIADKLHVPRHPMPVPVISETPEERALLHRLRPVQAVVHLAQNADVTFVGIGQMGEDAPIRKDGFLSREQLAAVRAEGAAAAIEAYLSES